MTLGNLKKKIYSVLAIDETTELPALCYAIDSTARKVASLCRCIKRKADITFAGGKAEAPADFICAAAEMPVIDFTTASLRSPTEKVRRSPSFIMLIRKR